jgi:hypothetical protein
MRGTIEFMADLTTGLVVFFGAIGFLMLLLGAMVAIEASTSGTPSAGGANALTAADLWMQKAQIWLQLAPSKLLGSHAISLGAKVTAGALAAAVIINIMNSLRTITAQRRR